LITVGLDVFRSLLSPLFKSPNSIVADANAMSRMVRTFFIKKSSYADFSSNPGCP
jgi:hypothetical protein